MTAPEVTVPEVNVPEVNMIDVIVGKRDGRALRTHEIEWFIDGYTRGAIPDEQAASLLMAVFLNGLDDAELTAWTDAMITSGDRLDLSVLDRPTTDKHSTGGVGDKISLPLCPLVAACGAAVPQLSGRGLGYFGGTLDKMESIPGWRANLGTTEILDQLREVGAIIAAAGDRLAPADRRLYALRDAIGTVESIPLIASSIMSKKIAEGTATLVLDVKVGSGAFMPDRDRARRLAETMVGIGARAGVRTVALLTRMDTPLGAAVGNALEVAEAVSVLGGGGPTDVVDLTVTLAREMCAAAGLDADPGAVLASGAALPVWERMVRAQGGDPTAPLPRAALIETMYAPQRGWVTRLDARPIGIGAWRLGAGRAHRQDPIVPAAGVVLHAKEGDWVEQGQPLLDIHLDDPARLPAAREFLERAYTFGPEPLPVPPLVIERIA